MTLNKSHLKETLLLLLFKRLGGVSSGTNSISFRVKLGTSDTTTASFSFVILQSFACGSTSILSSLKYNYLNNFYFRIIFNTTYPVMVPQTVPISVCRQWAVCRTTGRFAKCSIFQIYHLSHLGCTCNFCLQMDQYFIVNIFSSLS